MKRQGSVVVGLKSFKVVFFTFVFVVVLLLSASVSLDVALLVAVVVVFVFIFFAAVFKVVAVNKLVVG